MIPKSSEYLLILFLLILGGLLLKYKFRIQIFKNIKQAIVFWLILFTLGIAWDQFSIFRGHWTYPEGGTLGIRIGLIPLEDYIFIAATGFFALVLYRLISEKVK